MSYFYSFAVRVLTFFQFFAIIVAKRGDEMQQFSSKAYKLNVADLSLRVFLSESLTGSVSAEEGEQTRQFLHFHTQHELFFVGNSPLVMQIGEEERSFVNTALCIPPFLQHRVKERQDVYGMRLELRAAHALFPDTVCELSLSPFSYDCLARLREVYRRGGDIAKEMAEALLRTLFLDLYAANMRGVSGKERDSVDDYCMVIDDFVHQHYDEVLTLDDVARALHLSTKQTSRIIRSHYHTTLSALLNEKRLTVAASLLEETELSVTEIAERLFCRSDNYFFRLFRACYGCSPLQYRKRARQKAQA
jgi:AraC-like DNA-binding protein